MIIWLVSLAIAIVFVMRYAKKVKADKGSTFLSLQEQQDMMNEWGMKESETEAADDDAAATPKMSGRQKWSLIVFALTFVIMIVSFIPWADLGVTIFYAGATTQEVTTTVTGEELVSAARAEAAALKSKADAEIESERRKAAGELKNDISELALDIAGRVVEKEIDPETHKELIDDFISRVGDAS